MYKKGDVKYCKTERVWWQQIMHFWREKYRGLYIGNPPSPQGNISRDHWGENMKRGEKKEKKKIVKKGKRERKRKIGERKRERGT
jgi:hypothetical protein